MNKLIFILMTFFLTGLIPCYASDESDIIKIQNYLSSASMEAKFTSTENKIKTAGLFEYIPGHLKIIYSYPYHAQLIANENLIYFHIDETDSITKMNIRNQPLGIFLSNDKKKWSQSHPIIQHSSNALQLSLANKFGVIAMNFFNNNDSLIPYSIDMKDIKGNIKHVQFNSYTKRSYDLHSFDIPKD